MAAHPNLNPANAVTASRFLTLPPFLWAVANGWHDVALFAVIVCALLDKVDGLVAKVFDCKTPFGSVFDAIADGICYAFLLIVLVAYAWVPLVPVIIVLGMGALNTVFRGAYAKRAGEAVNYQSFAMERIVAFVAYMAAFGATGFMVEFYVWGCAALITIVVAHDAKRMLFDPVNVNPVNVDPVNVHNRLEAQNSGADAVTRGAKAL